MQRPQAQDADRVPGAAAGPAEIGLAGPHVIDQPCLVLHLARAPVVLHLDADRPAGQARDLVDEPVENAFSVRMVLHGEGARLRAAVSAGLVAAAATTTGKYPENEGQADKSNA